MILEIIGLKLVTDFLRDSPSTWNDRGWDTPEQAIRKELGLSPYPSPTVVVNQADEPDHNKIRAAALRQALLEVDIAHASRDTAGLPDFGSDEITYGW